MDFNSDHDGHTYVSKFDKSRLNKQQRRIFNVVKNGHWFTLAEIEAITGDPQASISARLRDFRKDKFGGLIVERRRRGPYAKGLHEYRLDVNLDNPIQPELDLTKQGGSDV